MNDRKDVIKQKKHILQKFQHCVYVSICKNHTRHKYTYLKSGLFWNLIILLYNLREKGREKHVLRTTDDL